MTNDLFLAILAMDSYNRTGGASSVGLVVPSGAIGNATVLSGPAGVMEDTSTGFFAQAYELTDGTKIVSYRGTDDFYDSLYGWPIAGSSSFTAKQAIEAAKFYQQVVAGGSDTSGLTLTDLYDADIELTGHSLGGGLAGFVGSLYGSPDVRIFDNMAYEGAAAAAYRAAASSSSEHLNNVQLAKDAYFLGSQPGQPIDGDDIDSFQVAGQFLSTSQSGAHKTTLSLGFDSTVTTPGPIERHSAALLVIAMYGSTSLTISSTDWLSAGQYIFPALFDDPLAKRLGIQSGGTTGTDSANGKMRTMIAYSAIDNGTMPYGDTAMQALFADANRLGGIIKRPGFSGVMAGDKVRTALGEILVQHAGDLAKSANTNAPAATGIFTTSTDSNVLSIDLSASGWTQTLAQASSIHATTTNIVGLGDLATAVFNNFASIESVSGPTKSFIDSVTKGKNSAFSDKLNHITLVEASLGGTPGNLSGAGATAGSGALLIGQLGGGTITGSANGNDVIVGGATINTGTGDDTILTSKTATINAGGGHNVIYADPQSGVDDTFNYASSAGNDLIIGDQQGGDTFTFNGADKAAFTVVWGGAGNDTFDINTSSAASGANVLMLTMNGVTADNLSSLDMSALQAYVQKTYATDGNGKPTIVILNASSSDTLEYNGVAVSSPTVASSSFSLVNASGAEGWGVIEDDGVNNKLTANGLDYSYFADYNSLPILDVVTSGGDPSTGLSLLNFANGELGISLNAGINVAETVTMTEMVTSYEGSTFIEGPDGPIPLNLGDLSFSSIRDPNYQDGNLVDPSVLNGPTVPELNIKNYLTAGADGDGSGGGENGGGNDGSNGGDTTVTVGAFASNQSSLDFQAGGFGVADTAANVAAAIDDLADDSNVAAITLTDGGIPVLQLSASQVANDSAALDEITNSNYVISVVDAAANVSANIDALNTNANVSSIALNDVGTPALVLSAQQALDDSTALSKIANGNYGVAISDTAADVSAAIDALQADAKVTSIALVDSGVPTLGLSVNQALNDTATLAKIANSTYAVKIEDTAAHVLGQAADLAADMKIAGITIVDTVADVIANATALASNAQVTSIVVEDTASNTIENSGVLAGNAKIQSVIVVDSVANALGDASSLQGDAVVVYDTAANVSAAIDALNADAGVSAIALTDGSTQALTLTVAEALDDTSALGKIGNAGYVIDIADTAANVSARLDALAGDRYLGAIALTDAGTPTLSISATQFVNDAAVLAEVTNSDVAVEVTGSAADVSADIDVLAGGSRISSINLTDIGTPTLQLDAARAVSDASTLAKIANGQYSISVSDTGANLSLALDALNADAKISSLTIAGGAVPGLVLSTAQLAADTAALSKITNVGYQIEILDTASNVLADSAELASDPRIGSAVEIDSVANVLAQEASIAADTKVDGVVVSDTATNVSAEIDALNADKKIGSVELTDAGTPTLALSVAQALEDGRIISAIANADVEIAISDTAANVAANFVLLNADSSITSINLTDVHTPMLHLSAGQAFADVAVLSKITNQTYNIAVSGDAADVVGDAPEFIANGHVTAVAVTDTAANVSANIDELESIGSLSSITVTDDVSTSLSLSAGQALNDTGALGKIGGSYSVIVFDDVANVLAGEGTLTADANVSEVEIADTATNVLSNATALAAFHKVSSVTVADTAEEVLSDENAISSNDKIRAVKVVDNAANIVANGEALNADAKITAIEVVDTATNIEENIAALSQVSSGRWIQMSIGGALTLTTTAAEALDTSNFSGSFKIDVVDTAANIAANIDQLNSMQSIESIAPTDGVAGVALSAYQAVFDRAAEELIASGNPIVVNDTAADVSSLIDALSGDGAVTAITLNDVGTPTLTLSVSQTVNDASGLGKITNSAYAIDVWDTAAHVSANAAALRNDANVASITIVDTAANILGNPDPASGNTQVTGLAVADTAAGLSANIDGLNGLSALSAIQVTDFNNLTLTVAQALSDTGALNLIQNYMMQYSGTTSFINVSDTAANIVANLSDLAADERISSIAINDTAANVQNDLSALEAVSFSGLITVVDTAANIGADLSAFNNSSLTIQYSVTSPEVTITNAAEGSNVATQEVSGDVAYWGSAIQPGQIVALTDNGAALGNAILQANGTFAATVALPNEGVNSIVATVVDSLGNVSSSSAVIDTLDDIAPTMAITSTPDPDDTGPQTFSGTVASGGAAIVVGQTVTLTDNGNSLGSAIVQSDGSFSTSVALPGQANNAILASVTDTYGNENSIYLVSDGSGQISIDAQQGTGTSNDLEFTGDVDDQNLWFLQSGNNLQIDILGTGTSVTVNNWFSSGSPDQLQEITAGGAKIDSQLSQLVQAMASYSVNNPGFDPASPGTSMPNDGSLQSTIAATWHA